MARGEAGRDSDYDIMVVGPDEAPAELQDCAPACRARQGLGAAKDILMWRRAGFQRRLHLKASLPSAVLREGRLLYAA